MLQKCWNNSVEFPVTEVQMELNDNIRLQTMKQMRVARGLVYAWGNGDEFLRRVFRFRRGIHRGGWDCLYLRECTRGARQPTSGEITQHMFPWAKMQLRITSQTPCIGNCLSWHLLLQRLIRGRTPFGLQGFSVNRKQGLIAVAEKVTIQLPASFAQNLHTFFLSPLSLKHKAGVT